MYAGPKALKKFKRLMMNRIKWKPKKAAAGVCVCGVGICVCVCVVWAYMCVWSVLYDICL